MSIRQRLTRLERQTHRRALPFPRLLTEAEWGDAFECYRSELAPRDTAFATAVATYRQAVTEAQAQCLAGDMRSWDLWRHFPAVAETWQHCAELAEHLLETTGCKGNT